MEKNKKPIKNDYTHISVILDRTGSMEDIRDDTIGGFNAFLGEQRAQKGKATLTLVQFDSQDPYEVIYRFKPIKEIAELTRETYVPRASTPLLDALGRGINDLEKSLAELAKKDRPGKVVFAVVTDGEENASREFTKKQVMKMIKEKTEKEEWQFVFLSADLGAIDEARDLGVSINASLAFEKDARGTKDAWNSLSKSAVKFRSGDQPDMAFEKKDRKQPKDQHKKK
jgi:Mg-chelatase subunit ChlD